MTLSWTLILASPGEERLIRDIFSVYEPLASSVEKESEPLEVSYGLALQRIDNFDADRDVATFEIWEFFVSVNLYSDAFKRITYH